MFKKNEIFKYKSKNEPDFMYDQFICVSNTKKIILKTKHSKHEEFSVLSDYIASLSTTLKDLLAYMNANFLNEVKVKCILTLKDFESKLTEDVSKAQKHSLCLRAYEDGLVTKFGSVFKILKLTNKKILFENASGSPIYSIHENDNLGISKKNTDLTKIDNNSNHNKEFDIDKDDKEVIDNGKFVIYQTENFNLENERNKFIENYVNKNDYVRSNFVFDNNLNKKSRNLIDSLHEDKSELSSFIEVSTSTKFYSNDLLIKIEDGMNHITQKIIESSKKISELSK